MAAKGAGKRFQLKLVAPESVKWAIIGVSSASYGLGEAYRIVPVAPCIRIVDEISRFTLIRRALTESQLPSDIRTPSIPILELHPNFFHYFLDFTLRYII